MQGTLVTVEWIPGPLGTRPTGFRLRLGTRPGAGNLGTVELPGTTTQVSAEVPSGRYYLQVVPHANGSEGPPSPEVAFVSGAMGCTQLPSGPQGLTASPNPSPTLTWTAATRTTPLGYELRAALVAGGAPIARLPLPASTTTFSTAGAPPGTYYVSVATIGACGMGEPSGEVAVHVLAPPPTALTAQVRGNAVTLTWSPSPGAARYVIEAGSAPGLADVVPGFAMGPTPGLFVPGVPPGRYYVRVRAGYGAVLSAPSNGIVVESRRSGAGIARDDSRDERGSVVNRSAVFRPSPRDSRGVRPSHSGDFVAVGKRGRPPGGRGGAASPRRREDRLRSRCARPSSRTTR